MICTDCQCPIPTCVPQKLIKRCDFESTGVQANALLAEINDVTAPAASEGEDGSDGELPRTLSAAFATHNGRAIDMANGDSVAMLGCQQQALGGSSMATSFLLLRCRPHTSVSPPQVCLLQDRASPCAPPQVCLLEYRVFPAQVCLQETRVSPPKICLLDTIPPTGLPFTESCIPTTGLPFRYYPHHRCAF